VRELFMTMCVPRRELAMPEIFVFRHTLLVAPPGLLPPCLFPGDLKPAKSSTSCARPTAVYIARFRKQRGLYATTSGRAFAVLLP